MIMIVCPVPSLLIVWAPHSLKMKVWWYNTVIGGLKLLWFQNMCNPPDKMTRGHKRGVSCQGGLSNQTSDRGLKPCCFCDFKTFSSTRLYGTWSHNSFVSRWDLSRWAFQPNILLCQLTVGSIYGRCFNWQWGFMKQKKAWVKNSQKVSFEQR